MIAIRICNNVSSSFSSDVIIITIHWNTTMRGRDSNHIASPGTGTTMIHGITITKKRDGMKKEIRHKV